MEFFKEHSQMANFKELLIKYNLKSPFLQVNSMEFYLMENFKVHYTIIKNQNIDKFIIEKNL